ncbi:MAG: glycosyltransferase [Oligoflexia bacterium]|nr:glycosyltransferase [Oligoflexia bacterium]
MLPKISIITIAKNSENSIEATLKSVARQQGVNAPDFEHWVIDGASTDKTLEIIKKYPHVKYISEPDLGISDAFNKGVTKSTGEWIIFLNSNDQLNDDYVVKDMLQWLNSDADVVYGMIAVINPQNGNYLRYAGKDGGWLKLHQRMLLPHPATFMNRRYFEKYGLFNTDFKIAMDYELLLRGYKKSKFIFVPRLINKFSFGGASNDASKIWKHSLECYKAKKINHVGSIFSRVFWLIYQGIRWTLDSKLGEISFYKAITQIFSRGY